MAAIVKQAIIALKQDRDGEMNLCAWKLRNKDMLSDFMLNIMKPSDRSVITGKFWVSTSGFMLLKLLTHQKLTA